MPRKHKEIIAYKDDKPYRVFASADEAARVIGVSTTHVRYCIGRGSKCRGLVLLYKVEPDLRKTHFKDSRRKPTKTYTAEIDGVAFHTEYVPEFKKCVECDIFKKRPPANMGMEPLCYIYSCGNRRIVQICQSFRVIWKRGKAKEPNQEK